MGRRRQPVTVDIRFTIVGGPHGGATENPTCYARTTRYQSFYRWTRPRVSRVTGKLLPPRLTPYARYQNYVEHVRRSLPADETDTLWNVIWPDLRNGRASYRVDVVAQFVGKRHSDPDHVASAIADALFPGPPRSKPPQPGSRSSSPALVWPRSILEKAPGDGSVLARVLDYRDMAEQAIVAVRIHGPYDRAQFADPLSWGIVAGVELDVLAAQVGEALKGEWLRRDAETASAEGDDR